MSRQNAILFVLLGATCMSFAALVVRLIDTTDGLVILTYRGLSQSLVVLLVACFIRRQSIGAFIRNIDRIDLFAGCLMGFAFGFYIFALLTTSVASALFILSLAPVFAAFLSWIVIGERPSRIATCAIGGAMIGVAIMVGGLSATGGKLGMIFAAISAFCFAGMLVTARKSGKQDMLTGNCLGAVFASIGCVIMAQTTLGNGLAVTPRDFVLMLILGAVTIGLGIAFVSLAAPNLPPAEVSLLVLLESALAPIWVWLFLSEAMSTKEIIGGLIILISVAILSMGRRIERRLKL